jgi:hypothetical protein
LIISTTAVWVEDKLDYLDPDFECLREKDRKQARKKLQPIEGAGKA